MAIRIKLRDGTEALVQATMSELQRAIRAAMQSQQLLEIEMPGGKVLVVNPQEIQYFVEEPEAAESLRDEFQAATG